MTTPETHFDVIVIGGGPGGYAAAIRLAQRGLGVACIEKEAVGGVCLNWGCIPSKALITTAQRFDWARSGAELGVLADNVRLDLPQAQKRNRAIVQHHTDGVAGLLRSNGARLIYGVAELSGPRRVRVRQPDGSEIELSAERALLLATGARPRSLPGFEPDGERILTAREAIFLERLPEHLIVVGGGVIGVELGGAYQRLGSQLTVLELGKSLLPGVDPDLVRLVHQRFTATDPGPASGHDPDRSARARLGTERARRPRPLRGPERRAPRRRQPAARRHRLLAKHGRARPGAARGGPGRAWTRADR